jgi:Tfp pilus assembly protein PilE
MRHRRDEAGFTLVELLISFVILGLIALPLAEVVIGYLKNTNTSIARLRASHDVQIAAAYFARDVANVGVHDYSNAGAVAAGCDTASTCLPPLAASIETGAAATGGTYPCGASSLPAAIVRFAWDDFTTGPTTPPPHVIVAYVPEPAGAVQELHRITCTAAHLSGSTWATPVVTSDLVVAHYLTALPMVACMSPTLCTASPPPQYVTMTLTIKDPADTNPAYSVTLTGQRRQT